MLRFSARTIVILAACCFTGLVALQIVWMLSAYQDAVALHAKAKKQFEIELQSELAGNEELKTGLGHLLDHFEKERSIGKEDTDWFYTIFVQAIDFSPKKAEFEVFLDGYSIVQIHKGNQLSATTLISTTFGHPDTSQMKDAGQICINCVLGKGEDHVRGDYKLLLFYKGQWAHFFEKLGFLIFLSLVLLIVLGILFREIIKKYGQEKRLSEAKNDFINNMTHEMQTPVFAIQMANKLIEEKTDDETGILPLNRIIEKEAGQLKQHAAKILELASLEGGQVVLHKQKRELNSLIKDKQPTIELMLGGKEGKLNLQLADKSLYTELDVVHFNNILVSLADNSIKYSDRSPQINIETGELNKMVYLKFSDKGMGISPHYLPYVFDKFFRVPHIKRNGITGFGLGLSYVKYIVDLHKGDIRISSEEGVGTTITVLFPKAAIHA